MEAKNQSDVLNIWNLSVSYAKQPVLWDLTLQVPQGKIVGVIGPNGAGKSTMFNLLTSLIPKTSGYIEIFDRELNRNEPEIFKNVGICP